ncbi:hypothetical protein ACFFH7_03520 [Kutzneria chonburiensis]|uniref:Uncharacterized protein n=2 Tax=Kutzneria chonburiensis TaxID=1483604 RepID=A0ABV6MJT5_9PSEU
MFRHRYHILVMSKDNGRPFGLVRVRKGQPPTAGMDYYTPDKGWQHLKWPSAIKLTGPRRSTQPISVWRVRGAKRSVARREKNFEYHYYVVVTDRRPKDDPYALIRRWVPETGPGRDQEFTPKLDWEHTLILDDIGRDKLDGESERITEEEAQRYVELFTRRYQERGAQ